MSTLIWGFIVLVAIAGGYIIDYQSNKLKWQNKASGHEKELEEIRKLYQQLKNRVENLETIAAGEPETFSENRKASHESIILDDVELEKKQNREKVEKEAQKRKKTAGG